MPTKSESANSPVPTASESAFEFAPSWRPDKRDDDNPAFRDSNTDPVLEGEFVDLNEGYSEFGEYLIATIKRSDGREFAWHAMTQVASTQLQKAMPEIGHILRITYGGKKESKNEDRQPYTRWRVENLTLDPKTKAKNLLSKFASRPQSSPSPSPRSSGQFNDEPPF